MCLYVSLTVSVLIDPLCINSSLTSLSRPSLATCGKDRNGDYIRHVCSPENWDSYKRSSHRTHGNQDHHIRSRTGAHLRNTREFLCLFVSFRVSVFLYLCEIVSLLKCFVLKSTSQKASFLETVHAVVISLLLPQGNHVLVWNKTFFGATGIFCWSSANDLFLSPLLSVGW